jgi:hypothetical protein
MTVLDAFQPATLPVNFVYTAGRFGAQRLPLSGVKRTLNVDYLMSSIDPKATSPCR